ncbi:hypothetical protein B7P43_G12821 [Cryptotermes secundus]|uniref:Uncharacterized protein n=1 Tax=Cryptotermes secundus TaxID=105785 RepID=A0A2J7RD68_9NEOP|nr:hypothetical protein B7P43_G12821 [Cryptotermes secundus]
MLINAAKSKAVCFTRSRVKEPLNFSLRDIVIPEASSCKYLGIIFHRNDPNWETSTESRETARICALFKAYAVELQSPCYPITYPDTVYKNPST